MNFKDALDFSEIVVNFTTVFALLLGAGWAIYLFIIKESPSLGPRVDITNSISWARTNDDTYKCHFLITIKNIGISSFSISKAKLTLWKFPKTVLPSEKSVVEISLTDFKNEEIVFEEICSNELTHSRKLIKRYVPNESQNATWNWLFKRDDDYWICIRVELYTKDANKYTWSAKNWSEIGEKNVSKESQ